VECDGLIRVGNLIKLQDGTCAGRGTDQFWPGLACKYKPGPNPEKYMLGVRTEVLAAIGLAWENSELSKEVQTKYREMIPRHFSYSTGDETEPCMTR
jgi:hypothetical protein